MKHLTTLLLASAALSSPAFAADFYADAPAVQPMAEAAVSDWTGFNVGIFGGAAFNPSDPGVLQIDQDLDGNFDEPLVAPLLAAFGVAFSGSRDSGITGGIAAGYDLQIDQFVVGGIVDIAYVDYADSQSGFSTTPVNYTERREVGALATARVRAGYLITNDVLAYVHGGLAAADVDNSFTSPGNPNGVTTGGDDIQFGYQVGVGIETRVADNITIGAEYAYTNLGDNDFNNRYANGPFDDVSPAGSDLRGSDRIFDFHTVKGTVKFHF